MNSNAYKGVAMASLVNTDFLPNAKMSSPKPAAAEAAGMSARPGPDQAHSVPHPHSLALTHLSAQTELQEVAVALCINGICQAVMMVSPNDLEAFAVGFCISEGFITGTHDILSIDCEAQPLGWQVDLTVLASCEYQLKDRKRLMAGPSGCGLCGIDSLEAAMNQDSLVKRETTSGVMAPSFDTIECAKHTLGALQKQYRYARGHHSAALFSHHHGAEALVISEDVGRHSALDKLIGKASLEQQPLNTGFAMLTSRCSHDLVIKCARAGIACLVTLAPPTNLAVQSAAQSGVLLFCFQQSELKRFA
ncbi:formate dehydrogenase accessory sulfurtransferase FdhD [Aestuariicella hydrocarbonica]|uniref:Formate dehydrogenase accessory sulfurtransferase FdhD n=1 Tax=Pseudomaricurvus hydrocarbonicus TaxID=1470433 RepID=A0A9E5MNC2_9GAMM|nr:formate dehydrogenase accessory sulfurtransferase FdhD [Aestuariicella hydrocarbonica]NHO67438.1 formate dehydrogenase accessory sulfurtransferase FdhD [Aestuariicella hydrocarbonica]